MTDVSAKRKRGRPRKDSNLCREGGSSLENATSFMKSSSTSVQVPHDEGKKCEEDCEVGSMVYGVVEGSFDAGYLISVRIGNNLAPFRGVVFQPRKVVAVTPANDVAPQAKMYERREIQVPVVYDNSGLVEKQGAAVAPPNYSVGNLRMVEEDEVMQAFEVSKKSLLASNGKESSIPPSSPPNLYYNENLFTDQSQPKTTPNLKLDLAFTTTTAAAAATGSGGSHKENTNIGYHQALVAGNPLLLPPDLIGDFIMDKPKTPPPPNNNNNNNNNNMEVQSRFGGAGSNVDAITNAHLELATPHRIADMDFLLTNANQ
ncbi:hypothetical protein C2S52_003274 [Perilla frutescens var. hirtella]|nr:hypothetical protein C2S52_003274 [Perilla frutescens var. hirtella]